jgi:hypothetical protein
VTEGNLPGSLLWDTGGTQRAKNCREWCKKHQTSSNRTFLKLVRNSKLILFKISFSWSKKDFQVTYFDIKNRKKQKIVEKRSKKIKIDQKSYHKVFSNVQKKAKIRNLSRSK